VKEFRELEKEKDKTKLNGFLFENFVWIMMIYLMMQYSNKITELIFSYQRFLSIQ